MVFVYGLSPKGLILKKIPLILINISAHNPLAISNGELELMRVHFNRLL